MTELHDHDAPSFVPEEAAPNAWATRLPLIILGAAIAVRIVVVMVMSRGWFFVIDDWDYLNRIGVLSVFESHFGHLTGGVAGYTLIVRKLVGYDYWPLYPLAVALSWPAVSAAAYWVWRRKGVERALAAAMAVLVLWFTTASWLQFGFAGVGYAIALSIIAVYVDELPFTRRNVALGLALGGAATFITTIGAFALLVRMGTALVYRRWTGVASTVPLGIGYGLLRLAWGSPPGTPPADAWTFTDVSDLIRLGFEVTGAGLRTLVPLPASFGVIVGVLLVLGAIVLLIRARLPYFGITLVLIGMVHLASIMVIRFLGSPGRVRMVFADGFDLTQQVISVRMPNTVITWTVIALVPFLPALTRNLRARAAILAAVALVTIFTAFGAVDRFQWISDKSEPFAAEVAGILEMRRAQQPVFATQESLFPAISERFTIEIIDRMIREQWDESLLASEIYDDGIEPKLDPEIRALFRFGITRGGPFDGTWAAVGAPEGKQCRKIDDGATFTVVEAVTFKLKGASETTLTWTDDFGDAIKLITEADWDRFNYGITVRMPAPTEVGPPTTLTFDGEGLTVCLATVPGP